jgi:hypothetical protein
MNPQMQVVDRTISVRDIAPKLLPYDAELLRWCVDSIVNLIDGSGLTYGVPAVALGIDIVAAHRCEWFGGGGMCWQGGPTVPLGSRLR